MATADIKTYESSNSFSLECYVYKNCLFITDMDLFAFKTFAVSGFVGHSCRENGRYVEGKFRRKNKNCEEIKSFPTNKKLYSILTKL